VLALPAQALDFGSMLKNAIEDTTESVVQQGVDSTSESLQEAFPSLPEGIVSIDSDQLDISDSSVVLYETKSCPYCVKARKYLKANKVKYKSRDIARSKSAQKEFKKLGGRGVPMILVGDKRLSGWNKSKLRRMLKDAGQL
jgi:glutaredoxin